MNAPELSVHNESRRALLLGFASGGLLLAFGVPSLAHAAAPVQPPVSPNPQYGGAGMPAFKDILSDEDITAVVAYTRGGFK